MHRSGSTTRASDEYFVVGMTAAATPPSGGGKGAPAGGQVRRSPSVGFLPEPDDLLLPKYDPQSSFAKKEASRPRSAESAVHVIPAVLIVCAFVLWFFSSPQLDVVSEGDSIVARIENMTIDGYSNVANSLLPDDVLPSAEQRNEEEVNGRMWRDKEPE